MDVGSLIFSAILVLLAAFLISFLSGGKTVGLYWEKTAKSRKQLDLPASKGLIPNLVASDEFNRKKGQAALPLVWQWNHNPDNALWSVTERKGFLRLKTGRIDTDFLQARNTLTQRTIGPTSSASVALDVSKMKDGDFAGFSAFQKEYGSVGVKIDAGQKSIVMITTDNDKPVEVKRIPLDQDQIYFRDRLRFYRHER